MTGLKNCLTLLSLILLSSLAGCSSLPQKVVTETKIIEKNIAVAERPKPLQLTDMYFYVVTEDNYEEFKTKFLDKNIDLVYYAISVKDYENLALNISELKRYIDQQKQIIIYYEKAVNGEILEESPTINK